MMAHVWITTLAEPSVALETRVVVGDCAVLPALGALSTVLDEVMTMTERTGVMHGTIESVLVLP